MLSSVLRAQDYERVAPKLPSKENLPEQKEKPEAPAESDDRPLIPALKGLLFLKDPSQIKKGGVPEFSGIKVEGLPLLQTSDAPSADINSAFRETVDKYLGQAVSFKSLNALSRDVVKYYREADLLVVNAIIPSDQDISNGVVQVLVFEGRMGKVTVEGNKYFASDLLSEKLNFEAQDLMQESILLANVGWINSNPFRQVEPVLSPGKDLSTTDIILRVTERFPVRGYMGYEDTGNDLTGDERWFVGANWGNAFLLDQQLNYQFTTSSDFKKMTAHSGSWIIPLPWQNTLTFFGSYAEIQADFANPLFNQTGRSWQASGRYAVPLPVLGPYAHVLNYGFDFKQSNNNLEFGGANVFNTTTDVVQFGLEYNGQADDPWGKTNFGISGFYSPGRLTDRNIAPNFNAARSNAKPEYLYGRFDLERTTKLPADVSWLARGTYQKSDANLLGSEQLGVGGYNTVRGYDEREANGDSGWYVSNEIHTPSVSFCKMGGLSTVQDKLFLLGFFDYGVTENYNLLSGEDPHATLAGAGPGMRYYLGPYLSVRFDYAWQLFKTGLNTRYDERGHLGIVLSY